MYGNYGRTAGEVFLSSRVVRAIHDPSGFSGYREVLTAGMMFGVNPWIVKQFRPQDGYLKRLAIAFVADILAGSVVNR